MPPSTVAKRPGPQCRGGRGESDGWRSASSRLSRHGGLQNAWHTATMESPLQAFGSTSSSYALPAPAHQEQDDCALAGHRLPRPGRWGSWPQQQGFIGLSWPATCASSTRPPGCSCCCEGIQRRHHQSPSPDASNSRPGGRGVQCPHVAFGDRLVREGLCVCHSQLQAGGLSVEAQSPQSQPVHDGVTVIIQCISGALTARGRAPAWGLGHVTAPGQRADGQHLAARASLSSPRGGTGASIISACIVAASCFLAHGDSLLGQRLGAVHQRPTCNALCQLMGSLLARSVWDRTACLLFFFFETVLLWSAVCGGTCHRNGYRTPLHRAFNY